MKPTETLALVVLLYSSAFAWKLPAVPELRQTKCSLYTGFADSPSFTSFCKQFPRATMPVAINSATSSNGKFTPSTSTEQFIFDGGATSTMSPVNPAISSVANSKIYELQNYTVTTSGQASDGRADPSSKPAPTELEVNCYVNGSKLPMSECPGTAGLKSEHGYTYTYQTTSSAPQAPSGSPAFSASVSSSRKAASSSSKPGSGLAASSRNPIPISLQPASSAAAGTTTSVPDALTSVNYTDTQNLTRVYGYTRSSDAALPIATPQLPSGAATSSSMSSNVLTPSVTTFAEGSTLSTLYVNSNACNDITNAEPHKTSVTTRGQTASATTTSASTPLIESSVSSIASQSASVSASLSVPAASSNSVSIKVAPLSSTVTPSASAADLTSTSNCNAVTKAEPHKTASLSIPDASNNSVLTPAAPSASTVTPSAHAANSTFTSDCDTITNAEPHKISHKSNSKGAGSTPSPVAVTSSTIAVSSSAALQAPITKPWRPTNSYARMRISTSTTTVIDATVTTIVPCATDIGKAAQQKRDPFMSSTMARGMCDAGVYCVNSTFVSDAPPSWNWDAVALKQGQTCLEDNVFNTAWVEQQCACAGIF